MSNLKYIQLSKNVVAFNKRREGLVLLAFRGFK